jgi:hypothetical protein
MRMVADVLSEHIEKGYCIVFMDDISVALDSEKEHEQHMRAVIDTLRKNSYRLKNK